MLYRECFKKLNILLILFSSRCMTKHATNTSSSVVRVMMFDMVLYDCFHLSSGLIKADKTDINSRTLSKIYNINYRNNTILLSHLSLVRARMEL